MAEIAVQAAISIIDKLINDFISVNFQRKEQAPVQDVHYINKWLNTMQAYLKDTEEKREVTEGLKDRVKQVRDLAHEIEDAIEEFMLEVPDHFHEHKITRILHDVAHSVTEKRALSRLFSRTEIIKDKIKDVKSLDAFRILAPDHASNSSGTVCYPEAMVDELVGIKKRRRELLDLIKMEEPGKMVVSVVGLRGSGKTTLIKEVYGKLKEDFECHALVSVPHPVPVEGISRKICAAMEIPVPKGTDANQKLRSYLEQKMYIIFLDGIWSNDEWNHIQCVLPDGRPGSRTIISTHIADVASYCAKPRNQIYSLEALTWDEGWELFCHKAFRGNKCPEHLVGCSQRIYTRCEGLPLAIVAAASLLSNKPQTTSEFEKLHNSLGSSDHLSVLRKILQQSYFHLSPNLRSCFLYFCNFPEDRSVTRGRLARLWIAEQFVEERNKTAEDMANEYLNELIQMNLVHASQRDLQGRVRSCRVQTLVREVIISKSEEDNFSQVFTERNRIIADQPPRRLSIDNFHKKSLPPETDLSRVRTLILFGRESCNQLLSEKPLHSFKFLRVLDLEDAALECFPDEVNALTLLRYLSLRNTKIKTVPRSIKNLQKLVTLDLRQTCVKKLPKKIRKLRKLLYLFVDSINVNQARVGAQMPPGIGSLESLQKLSLVKASKKIIRELGSLVQLRKLGITELESGHGRDLCASIENMEDLSSLHVSSTNEEEFLALNDVSRPPPFLCSLYLAGRLQNIPQWISSLHSLAKICLKGSKLTNCPLEAIQALPSLLELRLVDAYTREELKFKPNWFQKLVILEIEQFSELRKVVVEEEALPELQKLVLTKCMKLSSAPEGIHKLIKLEEILLHGMPEHENLISEIHETINGRNKRTSEARHIKVSAD